MNNLPPYKPGEKCPKCGHDDVAVRYCIGDTMCEMVPPLGGEHLDLYCKRCSYEWAEACVDEPTCESARRR